VLSLAAASLVVLWEMSRLWFYLDEWDFLANRGVHLGDHGLFYPHNEHWSTIPILIWRGLFNVVGVRYYWLYAVPLIIALLCVAHMVWRLMLRHGVDPWVATILVGSLLVLGAGWQDLLFAFQIGFVGSLAFGMLAIEATERDRGWWSALWGICAVMCSGIGVPMVAACGGVALVRRRPKVAVVSVVPPAVVFLAWWLTIGHVGTSDLHFTAGGLASYVWTGLTTTLARLFDLPRFVGAVLAVVLAAAALWWRNVPAVLAAMAVVLFAFVGAGRVSAFGAGEAAASRYSYLALALMLPLAGRLITTLVRSPVLRPVVYAGLVILIVVNIVVLNNAARAEARRIVAPHRAIDAAAYLVRHGGRFSATATPDGTYVGRGQSNLTLGTLEYWVKHGQFPVPAHVVPSRLRTERAILEVSASPRRANALGLRFQAHTATCVELRPGGYRPGVSVDVVLQRGGGSLPIRPSASRKFTWVNPITVEVTLLRAHHAQVKTYAFLTSSDRWLSLPGGEFSVATVTAVNDTISICQDPEPAR